MKGCETLAIKILIALIVFVFLSIVVPSLISGNNIEIGIGFLLISIYCIYLHFAFKSTIKNLMEKLINE